MSKILIAGFIILAVCVAVPVGAVGKSTADPNTGLSGAVFAQKVTYEARRQTVLSVLSDLSKMTGVTLKAGRNNEDWQVRDRKINVFAKGISLAELMSSIARVTKLKWSEGGSRGAVSYRLVMDSESAELMRKCQVEEQRVERRKTAARRQLVSELKTAAGMPADDLEKLKETSPYIYWMAKNHSAEQFINTLDGAPGLMDAWLGGRDWSQNVGSAERPIEFSVKSTGSGLRSYQIGSMDTTVRTSRSTISQTIFLLDPNSDYAKVLVRSCETKDSKKRELVGEELRRIEQEDRDQNAEPLLKHPDDSELHVKIKMNPDGSKISDIFAALAAASGFAVVSDSFSDTAWSVGLALGEVELRTALDRLETVCRFNWERHGRVLEFRSRDWCREIGEMSGLRAGLGTPSVERDSRQQAGGSPEVVGALRFSELGGNITAED